MKDIVSPELLSKFPEYIRGVVIARGVNNNGENQRLVELLRKVEQDATQDQSLQDIRSHPKRQPMWR